MTETGREFARNSMLMKKCRKIHGLVFYTYLVAGLIYIIYAIISGVFMAWDWLFICLELDTPSTVWFITVADSLVVAPGGFAMAVAGSYGKKDLYAMFSFALAVLNLILLIFLKTRGFFDIVPLSFYVGAVYSVLCGIVSALNIKANLTYHFLEEQYGFPHFNERFTQQDEDIFQDKILDKFTMNMREIQKNSSDSMDDLPSVEGTFEKYEHVHKPSDMDEL